MQGAFDGCLELVHVTPVDVSTIYLLQLSGAVRILRETAGLLHRPANGALELLLNRETFGSARERGAGLAAQRR